MAGSYEACTYSCQMRAREPLPNNRWTRAGADTLAAVGYWFGFLATLAADVLRDVVNSLRRRVTRTG